MNRANLPDTTTLTHLPIGSSATVVGYRSDTPYTAQLRRLGLVPGTPITLVRRAPLGDPIEIRLRGFSLALRPAEAEDLLLQVSQKTA